MEGGTLLSTGANGFLEHSPTCLTPRAAGPFFNGEPEALGVGEGLADSADAATSLIDLRAGAQDRQRERGVMPQVSSD